MKKGNEITILRLSGRGYRDMRITTHCCLVARAFGAQRILLDVNHADEIAETVHRINTQFGGNFGVEYTSEPIKKLSSLKKEGNTIAHLTMYGEKPTDVVKRLNTKGTGKIVIVVGADKVPGKVYELADYNVSITRQPHSEVAALAVFMHYLQNGKEEELEFGGKKEVIPNPRGKTIRKN